VCRARTPDEEPEPVTLEAAGVTGLGARSQRLCVVLEERRIRCLEPFGAQAWTEEVRLGAPVRQLAVGKDHLCALLKGGQVACWGDNAWGQLGRGTYRSGPLPEPVAGLSDAVEIGAGAHHTCARRRDGAVLCWGENRLGELGRVPAPETEPLPVEGLPGPAAPAKAAAAEPR